MKHGACMFADLSDVRARCDSRFAVCHALPLAGDFFGVSRRQQLVDKQDSAVSVLGPSRRRRSLVQLQPTAAVRLLRLFGVLGRPRAAGCDSAHQRQLARETVRSSSARRLLCRSSSGRKAGSRRFHPTPPATPNHRARQTRRLCYR